MSYPEYPSRGVLADMYGPTFYNLLRPLIECLVPAWEIEMDRDWITTDSDKPRLVALMLRRANELRADLQAFQSANQDFAKREKELKAEIVKLENTLSDERDRYYELSRQNSEYLIMYMRMKAEVEMCRKHPILLERQFDETVILPQTIWMEEWRTKPGFEKQSAILRIIGETGRGRMPDVRELAAAEFGYQQPSAGGITKAIDALQKRRLIAIRTAEKGMQGRPPKLVWLTDLGQAAYVLLTNKPPVKSELDTHSSHVSDAHMLLNLEAEDWLKQDGYEILAHAYRHFLDGVRQAVPDLTVRKDGEIFYIEVERSGKKSSRPEKWVNMRELTGGNIYVFCQYHFSQQRIAYEVAKALVDRGLSSRLTLTNLERLRQGWSGRNGSPWLEEIEIFPGMTLPGG